MTEDEVRQLVRAEASKQFALRAGVSVAYVDMVKRGERSLTAPILSALGLRRVVAYEKASCNHAVSGA